MGSRLAWLIVLGGWLAACRPVEPKGTDTAIPDDSGPTDTECVDAPPDLECHQSSKHFGLYACGTCDIAWHCRGVGNGSLAWVYSGVSCDCIRADGTRNYDRCPDEPY